MNSINANKPITFASQNSEKSKNKHKNTEKTLYAAVGAAIPIVHSVAVGLTTQGSNALKSTAAIGTARKWGFFIAGAAIFNKAADYTVNRIPALKKFSQDHPGITLAGLILAGVETGRLAVNYGEKGLEKILKNKSVDEKIYKYLDKSKILKNKTVDKTIKSLSNFANSGKGKFVGKAATIGLFALLLESFFDVRKHIRNASNNNR